MYAYETRNYSLEAKIVTVEPCMSLDQVLLSKIRYFDPNESSSSAKGGLTFVTSP